MLSYCVVLLLGVSCLLCSYVESQQCGPCGAPPDIQNSKAETSSDGTKALFSCKDGWMLRGSHEATCVNGKWDFGRRGIFTCKPFNCSFPDNEVPNSTYKFYKLRAVRRFSCNPGFTLEGNPLSMCNPVTKRWFPLGRGKDPKCVLKCKTDELTVDNSSFQMVGNVMTFSCNDDFFLTNNGEIKCSDAGSWEVNTDKVQFGNAAKLAVCVPRKCGLPPPIELATQAEFGIHFNGTHLSGPCWVRYRCPNAYHLNGSSVSFCNKGVWESQNWRERASYCELIQCADPPTIPNARFSTPYSDIRIGHSYYYTCDKGYKQSSGFTNSVQCQEGRKWSNSRFECSKVNEVTCGQPFSVWNTTTIGGVTKSSYSPGDMYELRCKEGHVVDGYATQGIMVTCQQDGEWSVNSATCKKRD